MQNKILQLFLIPTLLHSQEKPSSLHFKKIIKLGSSYSDPLSFSPQRFPIQTFVNIVRASPKNPISNQMPDPTQLSPKPQHCIKANSEPVSSQWMNLLIRPLTPKLSQSCSHNFATSNICLYRVKNKQEDFLL